MTNSNCIVWLRSLLVWLAASGTAGLAFLALSPGCSLDPHQPFAALLAQVCSVALLGCAAWAWLSVTVVAVEALRAPVAGIRHSRPGVPLAWRRIVLSACGVALSAGVTTPALATPGAVHLDPAPTAHTHTAIPAGVVVSEHPLAHHSAYQVVVKPGDSLWSIAAAHLGAGATNAEIDHAWRGLYDANREMVGPDPGRLEPGERLSLPRE